MALTTWVTPEQVATVLGQPTPESDGEPSTYAQWELWISDALMFIQDRVDKTAFDEADMVQAKLDYVIREVVADQVRRRDTDIPDGEYFDGPKFRTVADWYPLLGLTGASGAFGLDMIGTSTCHLPWCSSYFGATYCSCGVDIAGYPIFEGGEEV